MRPAKSYKSLYNTKQWYRLRAAQLRDYPLCLFCEQQGKITPATVVDHVIPHKGDRDLFFNGELASLCKKCHDSAKAKAEARGVDAIGCSVDGMPIDKEHHWYK